MANKEREKELKHISKVLKGNDNKAQEQILKNIREKGDAGLIPDLIHLLHRSGHSNIKNMIADVLINLKDQTCVPYLVESLKTDKYAEQEQILISACWQNGLDYSDYLTIFIDKMISGTYYVALESLTVIENASLDKLDRQKSISKVKNSLSEVDKQQQSLLIELIHILQKT